MGGYKIGVDRKQLTLVPVCLDDYIPEDHICRIISAFTELLDIFALGFKYAEYKDRGCRSYDPRMMLNLYLYGYLHRIRSSRRLQDEARRNIEVMWLLKGLMPDDRTICYFRADNKQSLKGTFREFVQMCRKLGLYGEEVEATDGVKIRANNSLKNNYNETVVKNELERIEKKINDYMEALEEGDKQEAQEKAPEAKDIKAVLEVLKERKQENEERKKDGEISTVDAEARLIRSGGDSRKCDMEAHEGGDKEEGKGKEPEGKERAAALEVPTEQKKEQEEEKERKEEGGEAQKMRSGGDKGHEGGDKEEGKEKEPEGKERAAALEVLKERKKEYEELQKRIEKEGEISMVDPDARLMRSGGDGRKLDVGYNVQTVVDSKYHLVVDFEVTNNSGDAGNLHEMSKRAKEILEAEELTVLADKGYYDSEDIAACEASGVTCLVAKKRPGGAVKTEVFSKDNFAYDRERDVYICPCKNEMEYKRTQKKNGGKEHRVYANYGACRECASKEECTKYKYREMWRLGCQDIMDIVDERTRKEKDQYRKRQEIVEHVFGTVKAVWGYKQYLCRGKAKVTAETALAYLAYNMRRVVNIFKESMLMPVFR